MDILTDHCRRQPEGRLARRLDQAVDGACQAFGFAGRDQLPPPLLPIVVVLVLILVITGRQRLLLSLAKPERTRPSRAGRAANGNSRRSASHTAPEQHTPEPPAPEMAQAEPPAPREECPKRCKPSAVVPKAESTHPSGPVHPIAPARRVMGDRPPGCPPRHFSKSRIPAAQSHAHNVTI